LKTILCIYDKQRVPFRASRVLETSGYLVFRVPDATIAGKVSELFAIDFVVSNESDCLLPEEIVKTIASTPIAESELHPSVAKEK